MSRMPLRYSRPTRLSCSPGEAKSVLNARATARYSVSWTSVDLPEPETPLTTVSVPNGTRNVTFFRLCWRAARRSQGLRPGPRRPRAHELGAELVGQVDPLSLATRQRPGLSAQREIAEADPQQERELGVELLEDLASDR